MLDETTCPVCGKELRDERISLTPTDQPVWAVAHYLAHLVQQNQPNAGAEDWLRKFNEFVDARYVRPEVDNIPPPSR